MGMRKAILGLLLAASACGGNDDTTADTDAGRDAPIADVSADISDASVDTAEDIGADMGADTGVDADIDPLGVPCTPLPADAGPNEQPWDVCPYAMAKKPDSGVYNQAHMICLSNHCTISCEYGGSTGTDLEELCASLGGSCTGLDEQGKRVCVKN